MKTGDAIYKGARWRKLRLVVLRENPVCVLCSRLPSNVVDHKVPHSGDDVLMWDRSNLQGVCKRCHDTKTATQDNHKAFGRWQRIPDFIKPPSMPVTIVCGPPGSGRSGYAKQHSKGRSEYIDPDYIAAELSTGKVHQVDMKQWLVPTMLERNNRLAALHRSRATEAWFVVTAPSLKERRQWASALNASVVVMETDEDTCIDRVRHSCRIDKDSAKAAVKRWWRQYVSDPVNEIVVRT